MISQHRAWMTTPSPNLGWGGGVFFCSSLSKEKKKKQLPNDPTSMRSQKHMPEKLTNRNSWRHCFIPHEHACWLHSFPPSCSFWCAQRQIRHFGIFAAVPPTSSHLLPVSAISQPSSCVVDVTEEASEPLSQELWCWVRVTERQERNMPDKQPVLLLCPFTYSSLSKHSADSQNTHPRAGKHVVSQILHTHTVT